MKDKVLKAMNVPFLLKKERNYSHRPIAHLCKNLSVCSWFNRMKFALITLGRLFQFQCMTSGTNFPQTTKNRPQTPDPD